MKNKIVVRLIATSFLLAGALLLLPACSNFGGKQECPTCAPAEKLTSAAPEEVLATLNGKPIITKASFDDFFTNVYLKINPENAFMAMDPQAKKQAFKELLQMKLLDEDLASKSDPKYQEDLKRAYQLARYSVNVETVGKELLDKIDVSDAALEKFYNDQLAAKNPAFNDPRFVKSGEGIKMLTVQFADEKSAKSFLDKAQKTKTAAAFNALAKDAKKQVKDLGMVTALSRVELPLRAKASTLQTGTAELVKLPGGQFVVLLGVGPRQEASYTPFAEVIKAEPRLKEQLANFKKKLEGQDAFNKHIDTLKTKYNAVENTKFFEEEEAKQKAELEARIKEMQEAAAKEATAKAPAKAEAAKQEKAPEAKPEAPKAETAKP